MTALCVPRARWAGDYYDFFPMSQDLAGHADRGRVGQGHVGRALMAEPGGLVLQSPSQIYEPPRQLLMEVNRIISENLTAAASSP